MIAYQGFRKTNGSRNLIFMNHSLTQNVILGIYDIKLPCRENQWQDLL